MPLDKELEARFFLADFIGLKVISPHGDICGRLVNFTIRLGEKYPYLPHAVIESSSGKHFLAERDQFAQFNPQTLVLI